MFYKKIIKDRETLEQRLKELSETEYLGGYSPGAMCYVPASPISENYCCPVCGHTTVSDSSGSWVINDIRKIVKQIKNFGYDVVLDEHEFCDFCSINEKIRKDNRQLIFKIRFSTDSKYHISKSNNPENYRCVLAFLEGKDFFTDNQDQTHPLHWTIKTLQEMSGLGENINPPSFESILQNMKSLMRGTKYS